MQWKNLRSDTNSSLLLEHTPTSENSNNPENISSSKYCDIDQMCNIKIPNKNKYLSLFHVNKSSLYKKIDYL